MDRTMMKQFAGAMRCRKTSGKFRNAKHDPASYTGEAQENRCRQRPSAKREKNNYPETENSIIVPPRCSAKSKMAGSLDRDMCGDGNINLVSIRSIVIDDSPA